MRPLQAIGMGLVLVVLEAAVGDPGLDLFPDWIGWLLVLHGVRGLPERIEHRSPLRALAVLAGVVSLLLWLPPILGELSDVEESLLWVLDLPGPLFVLVLARALGAAAARAGDSAARSWWRVVLVGTVVTVLSPAVVYGAGAESFALLAVAVAIGTLVACLVLCFAHSARPWVHDPAVTGLSPG